MRWRTSMAAVVEGEEDVQLSVLFPALAQSHDAFIGGQLIATLSVKIRRSYRVAWG